MRLGTHANSLETNTQAESQDFAIGDASVVIEILRNRLYEHKIRTPVQEYISNARDAVREVGKKDGEFIVVIPTALNPTFKIRDFGPGISPERMRDVFIRYGSSTKRGDDKQTGGFGLGCKSWWSYTDSFTIATFINGVKRSYVAHTGVNNQGRLDLISTEITTEKDGTEIQVAVRSGDVNEFRDAVSRAIYFWQDKPTLRGVGDVPTLIKGLRVGEVEIFESRLIPSYIDERWNNEPLAIVDGIPYPINNKLKDGCKNLTGLTRFSKQKAIIYVPTGAVDIAASREQIADSDRTKKALEDIAAVAMKELKSFIDKEFKAVKTPGEYINVFQRLNKAFYIDHGFAKYKDYIISGDHLQSPNFKKVSMTEVHCYGRYGHHKIEKITKNQLVDDHKKVRLESFNELYFLNTKESKAVQNKRIREHFDSGIGRIYIIEQLTDQPTKMPDGSPGPIKPAPATAKADFQTLVNELGIKDFTTLAYTTVQKQARVKVPREKTEFCLHVVDGGKHVYTTLADNEQKWLYVPINKSGQWLRGTTGVYDNPTEELRELAMWLTEVHSQRLCGVAERAFKMIENDKNFKPLSEWLANFKPTKKEIAYAKHEKAKNGELFSILSNITGIKDKKLTAFIQSYKDIEKFDVMPEIFTKKVNELDEIKEFIANDEEVAKLVKRQYSLLLEFAYSYYKPVRQELAFYLNAKYEEEK